MNTTETNSRVAAFFDLDGTLLPLPSLEHRFVANLRSAGAIPLASYLLWLIHAIRLAPHGLGAIAHANKTYLRGVKADCLGGAAVPGFFPHALDRVCWHARRGHHIVLVTGTLAPLANQVAFALTLRLAVRGITTSVGVCATQLEQSTGRFTGRIVGDVMFAEAKARAVWRLAASARLDLSRSYAYGDSVTDRWMLAAVGRPVAVNPSPELERLARLRDWAIFKWNNRDHKRAHAPSAASQFGYLRPAASAGIKQEESLG
jgi:alcohol-forming fatty acyl-CoA reductase